MHLIIWYVIGVCSHVQLNEALCASSPDLASPCEYQSPVDSMNTLALPVRSPRRRSMGVRNTQSVLRHYFLPVVGHKEIEKDKYQCGINPP